MYHTYYPPYPIHSISISYYYNYRWVQSKNKVTKIDQVAGGTSARSCAKRLSTQTATPSPSCHGRWHRWWYPPSHCWWWRGTASLWDRGWCWPGSMSGGGRCRPGRTPPGTSKTPAAAAAAKTTTGGKPTEWITAVGLLVVGGGGIITWGSSSVKQRMSVYDIVRISDNSVWHRRSVWRPVSCKVSFVACCSML